MRDRLEAKVEESSKKFNYAKAGFAILGALGTAATYPLMIHYFPNIAAKEEVEFVEKYGFPAVKYASYALGTLAMTALAIGGGIVALGLYTQMLEVDEREEKDLAGDEFIDKEYTKK